MSRRQQSQKQRRKCPDFRKGKTAIPVPKGSSPSLTPPQTPPRSKKKIPVLAEKEDLQAAFGVAEETPSFAEAIDQTLTEPEGRRAMQERLDSLHRGDKERGKPSIKHYPGPETELDLHGFTGPEAERRTPGFIAAARQKGLQTIRIITGKGLHSDGPEVLPDVVEQVLLDLKREGGIFAFRWEKKEKQRSGAVIVYLA